MKIGVRIKIDVKKIDKALLFQGKKGTYLDATVFIDPNSPDQYENHGMITQDTTDKGPDKGPILGNVKVFWKDEQQANGQAKQQAMENMGQAPKPESIGGDPDFDDDIPF